MLPLPPTGVTPTLLPYAVVAIAMIVVEIFVLFRLLPRSGGPPTLAVMLTGVTVLASSSAVLLALLQLLLNPTSDDAGIAVLWSLNFMMFAPPGIWVIAVIVYHDRRIDPSAWRWPALLAASVTVSEVMMGVLFSMDPSAPALSTDALVGSLTSLWFFWSMGATMVALLLWVRPGDAVRAPLWGLALTAFVAPWITAYPVLGGAAMMAAMGATFFFAFRPLVGSLGAARNASGVVLGVIAAFFAMSIAALSYAADGGSPLAALPFGAVAALVMGLELAYLTRLGLTRPGAVSPARSLQPALWSPPIKAEQQP